MTTAAKATIEKIKKENNEWYEFNKARHPGFLDLVDMIHTTTDFILELVQNADDVGSKMISVDFTQKRLFFYNDGEPFQEDETDKTYQNVSALCSVGKSTKVGKIGFMGLGFKSVFRVCSKIEVHSNPFHFILDAEKKIVPEWCEPTKKVNKYLNEKPGKGTIFILHLINNMTDLNVSLEEVKIIVKRLTPDTLIWLNSLEEVIIDKNRFKISRPEKSFESIKAGEDYYKKFESPRQKLHDNEKNDLIKHRKINPKTFYNKPIIKEVGISFKVDKNGHIITKKEGTCFAFLPLPDVKLGVKFDVNGDFNVDSHRKNIVRDFSPLNNWLFAQVGKAWANAYEYYKEQTDPELALQMLKLIPLQSESPDDCTDELCNHSFCFIKKSIDSYMINDKNKVFLADGNELIKDRGISLKNAFIPEQRDVKELFDILDLHKLHNRFAKWIDPKTPIEGVNYIKEKEPSKLINVFDLIKNDKVFNNIRKSPNRLTPEWFAKLIMSLSEVYYSDKIIKHYKNEYSLKREIINNLPVLLIDGKTVVKKIDVKEIFYSELKRKRKQERSEIFNYIHPEIIDYLKEDVEDLNDKKKRRAALDFLFYNKIIIENNAKYYLEKVIVPRFEKLKENEWKDIKDNEVDEILWELYTHKEMKRYWEYIKNKIPLKGNDGKYHIPNNMYLPIDYGGEFDATTFFSGNKDGFVLSKRYKKLLVKKSTKRKRHRKSHKQLYNFFESIGVKTGIELIGGKETRISKTDLQTWLRGEIPKETSDSGWWEYQGYRLIDYDLPSEIKDGLKTVDNQSKEKSHNLCLVFFSELVRKWPEFESKTESEYIRFDPRFSGKKSRTPESAKESSWIRFLSNTIRWIPVIGPGGKDCSDVGLAIFPEDNLNGIEDSASLVITIPKSLMQTNRKNIFLFRDFYFKQEWEPEHSIDFEIVKLRSLANTNQKTNIKNRFLEIYRSISESLEETNLQLRKKKIEVLDSYPWIYTPSSSKRKRKKKYRRIKEVKWGDPKIELDDWIIDISLDYPSLKDFFIRQIGIGDIKPIDYLCFIQDVLIEKKNMNKTDLDLLYLCYRKIELAIREENVFLIKEIKNKFNDLTFWCYGKKWVALDNKIYYLDDEKFYNDLKRENVEPNIIFVPVDTNPFPYLFFKNVNINPLSSIKKKQRVHYESEVSLDTRWIKKGITEILPDIKLILKNKDFKLYQEIDAKRIFDLLKYIKIIPVKNLYTLMDIDLEDANPIINKEKVVISTDEDYLAYIDETIIVNEDKTKAEVSIELDNLLGNALGHLLYWSLWDAGGEKRDIILEKEGIKIKKRMKENESSEEPEEPPPIKELVTGEKKDVFVGPQHNKERLKGKKKKESSPPMSTPRKNTKPEYDGGSQLKKEWKRLEIERRAIEIVLDLENRDENNEGYKAIDVHELKLGYDVVVVPQKISMFEYDEEAYAQATKKFIEIKASKHDSDDFIITNQEIEKAKIFSEFFFIYRVTDAMSNKPIIYIVDHPLEQYHDAIDEKIVKIIQDWKSKEGLHYVEIPYHTKYNIKK